jgi:hypothetical protein
MITNFLLLMVYGWKWTSGVSRRDHALYGVTCALNLIRVLPKENSTSSVVGVLRLPCPGVDRTQNGVRSEPNHVSGAQGD